MKSNPWELVAIVVILTMLVPGLAMLLAGCGSEVIPAPVQVKPTATPVPAAPPTDTVPPPAEVGEASAEPGRRVIDDFEGGDFDDRWWSYTDEGTVSFACAPDQPGHASAHAIRLTFEVGAGGYADCGIDVAPERWGDAGGLSFFWRAERPGLTVSVVLDIKDPTQTNPEAEGVTPFEVELQTPGEKWTPVMLEWEDFAKAEWVGGGGVDALDPTRVVGLYFEVIGEQSGSVWFDDLQLMTGFGVATSKPLVVDKWALWTGGTHLRGANIWQRVVVPDLDGPEFLGSSHVGPPYTQADFDRLAALGANYVNISGPGLFTEKPPYVLDEKVQAHLDNLLDMIAQADMFAVITFRTGPGRSDFTFYRDGAGDWFDESLLIESVWEEQEAQDAWVEMWRYTAGRYRDNPIVVGYDLMCEPNSAGALLEIWEPDEFYPAYAGTLYDWNQLYLRITAAIREVDPHTPILAGGMGWSAVRWLPYLEPTGDPRTVYMVHQYEPQEQYTHQEPPAEHTYPGEFDLDWDGVPDLFNRHWLDEYLAYVDAFQHEHGAPVAVNEFGVVRWVDGGAAFMDDEMDLFEGRGMNYALWSWDPAWKPWTEQVDAFNFRHGPDPDHHADVESSDLIDVIVEYWERNTIRPSSLTEEPAGTTILPVASFLYQLQNINLEAIGDTGYDLVVMDYSAEGGDGTAFTAAQIAALKHSPGGDKIVLAYMSIGEAENYRFYWQDGWTPGNPAWLDAENPHWPGNYKVHYWDPAWQTIVFNYADRLLDAGFDGAYLDIIDAYEYYTDQGRAAAVQEMADFVATIRAYARARDLDFYIFPQNVPELAEKVPAYLSSVDGIGQEDIYYGYDGDDVMTPPEVTAGLEGYLDLFKNAGKLVLTVDYATTPSHVNDAYARSQAKGYVPFVTVRHLDRLTVNPGHEPD